MGLNIWLIQKESYCLIIKYTHLDFNVDKEAQIEIKANGVEDHCHIYEDRYGTHITSTNQMCALDVLNQFNDFDYLYDGQYINKEQIAENYIFIFVRN